MNTGRSGVGLRAGMVFAIEPMIKQDFRRIATEPDDWTVVITDKKLLAQLEHRVEVTVGASKP
jgi:methionyl aminopeptidase